jgi:hypothetical protein
VDSRLVNRMLELRVKDLAGRSPGGSVEDRRRALRRSLGLEPLPARLDLKPQTTGVIARDGYRIEKLRYESIPGVPVMAHLYLPDGEARRPLVLRPHDHWPAGMRAAVVQAGAISLALCGFACLVIAAPGVAANGVDDHELNERRAMGGHDDIFLGMGAPVQGQYVWDVMRGLDVLDGRSEIDLTRVGITGEGAAAETAMLAFAIDDRITTAVIAAGAPSFETQTFLECSCEYVPGHMAIGDRSDVLGLRAPHGAVMLMATEEDAGYPMVGHLRTDEKLRKVYRSKPGQGNYRFERFFGGHDYHRRMREAALAFFTEHLFGGPASPCRPEPRPLTDGHLNPYPSGTVDAADPELEVSPPWDRQTRTFRDLLDTALSAPQPEPYRIDQRMVTWRKYGNQPDVRPGAILAIHDSTVGEPKEPGSIALPSDEIDLRLATLLGMSGAEVLAQMLHFSLPGGPEGWEATGTAIGGDALTSMIASMKTLVSTPEAPPKLVVAEGPVASMVARFLARYRPSLDVQATHTWTSWREAVDHNVPENSQPGAKYLEWL